MTGRALVRKDVRQLRAYEEEPQGGLDLMANTNLFGPNPAVEKAFAKIRPDRLTEYPSLLGQSLKEAVGKKLGVAPGMVVTGNGSNEIIDEVCRTFLEPGDRAAFHVPTFSMIPIFVRLNHGQGVGVPLDAEWNLDAQGLVDAEAKVTFVVRPNNPTGNAFPRKEVERVVERADGIIVVDEAYIEFLGGESFVKEVKSGHERLIVLRTLSKAHGIAGLRVGYGVMGEALAEEVGKVRGPFRLDVLAETVGAMALADDRYLDGVVAGVRAERPHLKRMLEERGFTVFHSDANFVLTKPPVSAHALSSALGQAGVWVRDFAGDLAPYVRITVGPPSATAKLRVALDDALPKLKGGA